MLLTQKLTSCLLLPTYRDLAQTLVGREDAQITQAAIVPRSGTYLQEGRFLKAAS